MGQSGSQKISSNYALDADAVGQRIVSCYIRAPRGNAVLGHPLRKFYLLILVALAQAGCTTCHTKLMDTATEGQWKANLEYRICGSVSGFIVDVYSNDEGPHSTGEGALESFHSIYKQHRHEPPLPTPITLKWVGKDQLLIKHTTRADIRDTSTDLMVRKAKTSYKGVSILYEPWPVIWD